MSIVDQPEEHCDLTPQKTCRHKTTLVPKLQPSHECTTVPREVCNIKYVNSRIEKVPFKSLWCQDEGIEVKTDLLSDGVFPPDEPESLDGYQYAKPENPLVPTTPPRCSWRPKCFADCPDFQNLRFLTFSMRSIDL